MDEADADEPAATFWPAASSLVVVVVAVEPNEERRLAADRATDSFRKLDLWAAAANRLLVPVAARMSLADNEDSERARCMVLAVFACIRWLAAARVCLPNNSEPLDSSQRTARARHEPLAWRDNEPLAAAAAELANFEATMGEVFLLWASALAAANRRASATRDTF